MSSQEITTARRDLIAIMAEILTAEDKAALLVGLATAAEIIEQARIKIGGREC